MSLNNRELSNGKDIAYMLLKSGNFYHYMLRWQLLSLSKDNSGGIAEGPGRRCKRDED